MASDPLRGWCRSRHPEYPHVYAAESGTALLFHALQAEPRGTVILPGFTCPQLSAMALRAGKRLLHLDVDPSTMHAPPERIEACLRGLEERDTVLLVDHAFGYPAAWLPDLRRAHPHLLIVEDCVRALGAEIGGHPAGAWGDWVLYSLYKTTPVNHSGAILLTRTPYPIAPGPAAPPSPRDRLLMLPGAVSLEAALRKRKRPAPPDDPPLTEDLPPPEWKEELAEPGAAVARRFLAEAARLARDRSQRLQAAAQIRELLPAPLVPIREAEGGAGHFVCFTVPASVERDRFVEKLVSEGVFARRTWYDAPARYPWLAETFPDGGAGAEALARRIVQIPVREYRSPERRAELAAALRKQAGATSPRT